MELLGTYTGTVIATNDPDKIGRVKVRVPLVYGPVEGQYGNIPDGDIPWALPAGLAAGHSKQSGGISWLPVKGDHVWVRFLDGEPEKPVWEWGNQYLDDTKTFNLNTYGADKPGETASTAEVGSYDGAGEPIKRAALTRYSHILEMVPTQVLLATSAAYSITLVDRTMPPGGVGPLLPPDGYISIRTLLGNNVELYDDQNLVWINSLDMFMANFIELSFNGSAHWHSASFAWQVSSQNTAYIYAKTYFGEDSLFSAIMGDNVMISSRNTLWLTANTLIEMMSSSVIQIGATDYLSMGSTNTLVSADNWVAIDGAGLVTVDSQYTQVRADFELLLSSTLDIILTSHATISASAVDIALWADAETRIVSPAFQLQTNPDIFAPGSIISVVPDLIEINCAGRLLTITPAGFFFT